MTAPRAAGQGVADAADRRARRNELGEEILRHSEPRQRFAPPLAVAQREHAGPRAATARHLARPACAPLHPSSHAASRSWARCRRGQRAQRRRRQAGRGGEPADFVSEGARLVRPADVVPGDDRTGRLPAPVEQHARLGHPGDPDRGDLARRGLGERARCDRERRARDRARVELGAGRHGRPRRPLARLAELFAFGIEHERLAVRRVDVDANQ